jgi:hypothetical protein
VTRRLVQLLLVFILVLSPFGRLGLGAAHGMTGHCAGAPASHQGKGQPDRVDCTIACAAIAPAPAALDFAPPPAPPAAHPPLLYPFHPGLHAGADPPPPRLA